MPLLAPRYKLAIHTNEQMLQYHLVLYILQPLPRPTEQAPTRRKYVPAAW